LVLGKKGEKKNRGRGGRTAQTGGRTWPQFRNVVFQNRYPTARKGKRKKKEEKGGRQKTPPQFCLQFCKARKGGEGGGKKREGEKGRGGER